MSERVGDCNERLPHEGALGPTSNRLDSGCSSIRVQAHDGQVVQRKADKGSPPCNSRPASHNEGRVANVSNLGVPHAELP